MRSERVPALLSIQRKRNRFDEAVIACPLLLRPPQQLGAWRMTSSASRLRLCARSHSTSMPASSCDSLEKGSLALKLWRCFVSMQDHQARVAQQTEEHAAKERQAAAAEIDRWKARQTPDTKPPLCSRDSLRAPVRRPQQTNTTPSPPLVCAASRSSRRSPPDTRCRASAARSPTRRTSERCGRDSSLNMNRTILKKEYMSERTCVPAGDAPALCERGRRARVAAAPGRASGRPRGEEQVRTHLRSALLAPWLGLAPVLLLRPALIFYHAQHSGRLPLQPTLSACVKSLQDHLGDDAAPAHAEQAHRGLRRPPLGAVAHVPSSRSFVFSEPQEAILHIEISKPSK